jgi:hypothetical protein
VQTRWVGVLAIAALVVAIVVYKQTSEAPVVRAPDERGTSEAGASVLLFADPREADKVCGCGDIFKLVRHAAAQGVVVREIPPQSGSEDIREHRVLVAPTVIVLDSENVEVGRYEGEDRATIEAIRSSLDRVIEELR